MPTYIARSQAVKPKSIGIPVARNMPTPPTPATPQPGVPLTGQIFPLAEGLYHPCLVTENYTEGGGGGGGGGIETDGDYAALIIGDAPRSYWRLGEPESLNIGGTVVDAIGANNGTAAIDQYGIPGEGGGAFGGGLPGLVGGDTDTAFIFGGYGYIYVGIGQGLQLQRFSLEALIKLDNSPPLAGTPNFGAQPILSYDSTDSNAWGRGYHFYINAAGKLRVQIGDGLGVWFYCTGATVLAPATAYHVAATFDGYFLRVYLNGVLDAITDLGGLKVVSYTNATGLHLAMLPNGSLPPNKYKGILDEVAIYPAALDAAALLRHKVEALG